MMGLTAVLVGCGNEDGLEGIEEMQGEARSTQNGLSSINGLTSSNGLASNNGLSLLNGLNSINGLTSSNGLMTTSGGRQTVSYLVKCALPAGRSIVKRDQYGTSHTFHGAMGMGASWEFGSCDSNCQQHISACMMAHVNTAGVNIPLWMVSDHPNVGWGRSRYYPNQEGSFFGNIFVKNSYGVVEAYYCNGANFASGVVPGRLGATQYGAPYKNLWGGTALCNTYGTKADYPYSNDGFKAAGGWNHVVTVWRK
jgi:hypothetical protein